MNPDRPSRSFVSHPVTLILIQVATIAFAVGFTSSSSIVRLAGLPILLGCVWLAVPTCSERLPRTFWANVLGATSVSYLLQYIDVALLSKWTFEADGPTVRSDREGKKNKAHTGTVWERLRFGLLLASNCRYVGTPYAVKNIPLFSSGDPSYVPSRATFLRRTVGRMTFCYLLLDIFTSLGSQPEQNAIMFSPAAVRFLKRYNELSAEQVIIRIMSTMLFWISGYCVLQVLQGILAAVAVGTGLDKVESWRPNFGQLAEAYTVRQFWSVFWHQYQRQRLSGPANFMTNDLLGLQKGTLVARYTAIFLTFLLSGFMHLAADLASGIPWQQSGAIRFFCIQVIGIMLEDGVQAIYRSARGLHRSPGNRSPGQPPLWTRLIGYIWVLAFLSWSSPAWIYPTLRMNKGEDKDVVLPFSFVAFLRSV